MARRQRPLWPVVAATLIAVGTALSLSIGAPEQHSVTTPPPIPPVQAMALAPQALLPLAQDEARAANAEQAFVSEPFPAAIPYRFTGDTAAEARAADCLAAAVLYEAGDDADGQRAVAQVVVNRARHPAYPASICGVVFQGSERRTGCQFTFTCDGALRRRYADDAWQRARGIAIDFLNGAVDPRVGLATHYHTDWVRPTWSASLDKLAQVGTHLFFRWQGFWGTPAAFRRTRGAPEPLIGRLAGLSPAHAQAPDAALALMPVEPPNEADIAAASAAAVRHVIPQAQRRLGDIIILTLDRRTSPENFPAMAAAACGSRTYCVVMGWTDPGRVPASAGLDDVTRAAMSFSYLRNEAANLERALWNCTEFTRPDRRQCMRR